LGETLHAAEDHQPANIALRGELLLGNCSFQRHHIRYVLAEYLMRLPAYASNNRPAEPQWNAPYDDASKICDHTWTLMNP
jgi:hypothetical protein